MLRDVAGGATAGAGLGLTGLRDDADAARSSSGSRLRAGV